MKTIAKFIQLAKYKDKGILGVGSKQKILEYDLWCAVVKILHYIQNNNFISKEQTLKTCSFPLAKEALDLILELNILVPLDDFNNTNRYSRNHLYYRYMDANPKNVQNNLNNSSVTIIGCGGIGSNIAYFLATSGVANICLIDNDIIELSNLTRQVLFTEDDIGKKKTTILKRELLKRNASTNITINELEIKSQNDLKKIQKSDLFIISADYPLGLMTWINNYCVEHKQAYLNIGYINDISVVGPFYIPGKTACLACHDLMPNYNDYNAIDKMCNDINNQFKSASFSGVNGVSASYAFNDIIKFLGKFGTILSSNRRIGIHSSKAEFEFQLLPRNSECLVCSKIIHV